MSFGISPGPGIHVNDTLTFITYLNIVADKEYLIMAVGFLNVATFCRTMCLATLQELFRNGLMNMTKSS
ncbi:hypothetical protein QTP70_020309, partial [Hemibagrus guttatus]